MVTITPWSAGVSPAALGRGIAKEFAGGTPALPGGRSPNPCTVFVTVFYDSQ